MLKFILNDQIVDQDKALIHVSDLALLRAYGVFDFFRLVNLTPLFFDNHIDRFFNSAHSLRLKCPLDKVQLKTLILKLISLNKINNSGIRIVLTGGESPNGYSIGDPKLFVINEPINPLPEDDFKKGIKLVSHKFLRALPEVKSINYLVGIYNMPKAQKAGATDLLFYWDDKISELTRSNFFIVDQNDKVITAKDGILKGVNRQHVLDIATSKFIVEERDLFMQELSTAKEAFITGTTKKVMPVKQIDDLVIGNGNRGQVTYELQKMFEQFINKKISEPSS